MTSPILRGEALKAVKHRGSHMQLIAAAGSGKTEVVSQRVADLLADGVLPESTVAFTFTERAAEELKNRISKRVEDRLGGEARDLLSRLFVGTIHSYSFRILQQYVPRYETFDVLEDNRLTAFLAREAHHLRLRELDPRGRLFASISTFLRSLDVVENELLPLSKVGEPFRGILQTYRETLNRYRLLTFGQQIQLAVEALQDPLHSDLIRADLRYLIVDEYQDVNPAQERLIELLAQPPVELCVVGDDDQAIYQWRGSDVGNIVRFADRYTDVATFTVTKNRRSRPTIIKRANKFSATIPGRLPKSMGTFRDKADYPEVVAWKADTEVDEAAWIAQLVTDLHRQGIRYRDIAVLVRTGAAYKALVDQFAQANVPVQPGGRTGLFEQPEAIVFGKAVAWLTDLDWRHNHFDHGVSVTDKQLFDEFAEVFDLDRLQKAAVMKRLRRWKADAPKTGRTADLVGEFYGILNDLGVSQWDLRNRTLVNRIGTLARFSALLADYESVRRRARPDSRAPGEQVGGQDHGIHYYRNLGLHIINYATANYDAFDGESDFDSDAVDLTTVHRAKGLEWPVVFVPSLTTRRFPSDRAGRQQKFLIPRTAFNAERYEGTEVDERRLFYVAMTRARDWLSLSRHERVVTQSVGASPYWLMHEKLALEPDDIEQLPTDVTPAPPSDDPVTITYSDMALYLECARAYRLRTLIGFQPRLARELGYGKAVHHVLRSVADLAQKEGRLPEPAEIDGLLESEFFLPAANKAAYREMKQAAQRLVNQYVDTHTEDLFRIWQTERPFELHLDDVTVSGRADVILDREGGVDTALAIVDYKTSVAASGDNGLQLQVYSDAGRREGLDVRGAYVHDLQTATRSPVPIDSDSINAAERKVRTAAARLRARDFRPSPGKRCRTCDVRAVCRAAKNS
ncbi:MAG: ATP-dependent DNA helicase [Mycobacterium sp.]